MLYEIKKCLQHKTFLVFDAPCPTEFDATNFSETQFGISVAAVMIFPAIIYALMIFLTRETQSKVRIANPKLRFKIFIRT